MSTHILDLILYCTYISHRNYIYNRPSHWIRVDLNHKDRAFWWVCVYQSPDGSRTVRVFLCTLCQVAVTEHGTPQLQRQGVCVCVCVCVCVVHVRMCSEERDVEWMEEPWLNSTTLAWPQSQLPTTLVYISIKSCTLSHAHRAMLLNCAKSWSMTTAVRTVGPCMHTCVIWMSLTARVARKVISVRDLLTLVRIAWIYTLQQLSACTITDEGGRSLARVNKSLTWTCTYMYLYTKSSTQEGGWVVVM